MLRQLARAWPFVLDDSDDSEDSDDDFPQVELHQEPEEDPQKEPEEDPQKEPEELWELQPRQDSPNTFQCAICFEDKCCSEAVNMMCNHDSQLCQTCA